MPLPYCAVLVSSQLILGGFYQHKYHTNTNATAVLRITMFVSVELIWGGFYYGVALVSRIDEIIGLF